MKQLTALNKLFETSLEPLIVDCKVPSNPQKNQYQYIYNAISNSQNNSVIKINSGIYQQSIEINQLNLKIQSNEPTSNIIIVNKNYPSIKVNLDSKTDKLFLEGLKFAHLCEDFEHCIKNSDLKQFRNSEYRGYKIGHNMNTNIYVQRGIVQFDECKISLANSHSQNLIPCLVIGQEGTVIMNRCQVRGGKGTIGIYCKGGKIIIKQSKIKDHEGIGILATGKNCAVTIKNSSIQNCTEGIILNGPFTGLIENNIFNQNECSINIRGGNSVQIKTNQIKNSQTGIYVINSYPQIVKNIIYKNQQGIQIGSKGSKPCQGIIKLNQIWENSKVGIHIWGPKNISEIMSNEINFNAKQGIKVNRGANPHIFKNIISKNLGNGIHIMTGSTAFIERNQIIDSLKANIVLEGPNNISTYVFENIIKGARTEGIFIIYGQKFFIVNNEIYKNQNGLLATTSVCQILQNRIHSNDSNGIFLVQDNHANIIGNNIEDNKKAGLLIRDTSLGLVNGNHFIKNQFQMVIEDDNSSGQIMNSNQFKSMDHDIRIPSNYVCSLI